MHNNCAWVLPFLLRAPGSMRITIHDGIASGLHASARIIRCLIWPKGETKMKKYLAAAVSLAAIVVAATPASAAECRSKAPPLRLRFR